MDLLLAVATKQRRRKESVGRAVCIALTLRSNTPEGHLGVCQPMTSVSLQWVWGQGKVSPELQKWWRKEHCHILSLQQEEAAMLLSWHLRGKAQLH